MNAFPFCTLRISRVVSPLAKVLLILKPQQKKLLLCVSNLSSCWTHSLDMAGDEYFSSKGTLKLKGVADSGIKK